MFTTIKPAKRNNRNAGIARLFTATCILLEAIISQAVSKIIPAFQNAVTSKYPKNKPRRSINLRYNSSGAGFLFI